MRNLLFLVSLLAFTACVTPQQKSENVPNAYNITRTSGETIKRPKNIVLLIGDGMGLAQITAGMYANGNKLQLERFPVVGLQKTHAHHDLITDSAAGATAFACGKKSFNAAIGVGPDSVALPTILEMAEKSGLATGLVATSTITHATPASFIAHNSARNDEEGIAADFMKTDIDFIVGGGQKFFNNRADGRDLCAELRKKGYYVSDFIREPLEMLVLPNQPFAYFTATDKPLPYTQGRDYLPLVSKIALDFLTDRGEKGFFAMIEGSQIDWGGHANDFEYMVTEMIDFDQTIGAVLDWAIADGETLVIITADHECGGLTLKTNKIFDPAQGPSLPTNQRYRAGGETRDSVFSTNYHTASMVPVFAYGPGAEQFAGIYENTAIFDKMRRLLGL